MYLERSLGTSWKGLPKDMVSVWETLAQNANTLPALSKRTAKLLRKEHVALFYKFKAHLWLSKCLHYYLPEYKREGEDLEKAVGREEN